MNKVKVLYFINDSCATEDELELASEINGRVCFRNARFISESGCLEECNFVFGAIPKSYSDIPVYSNKKAVKLKAEDKKPNEDKKPEPIVNKIEDSKPDSPKWQPNI